MMSPSMKVKYETVITVLMLVCGMWLYDVCAHTLFGIRTEIRVQAEPTTDRPLLWSVLLPRSNELNTKFISSVEENEVY